MAFIPVHCLNLKHQQDSGAEGEKGLHLQTSIDHLHPSLDWTSSTYYMYIQSITIYKYPDSPAAFVGSTKNSFNLVSNWTGKDRVLQTFECRRSKSTTEVEHINFSASKNCHEIIQPDRHLHLWLKPEFIVFFNPTQTSKRPVSYAKIQWSAVIFLIKGDLMLSSALVPSYVLEVRHKQLALTPAGVTYEKGTTVELQLPQNYDWPSSTYYIAIQSLSIYNYPWVTGYGGASSTAFIIKSNWTEDKVILQTCYCVRNPQSTQVISFNFHDCNIIHHITNPSPTLQLSISPIFNVHTIPDIERSPIVNFDQISLSASVYIYKA